jgi:predicted nucleic acid-binding Zn ribbon protein
MPHAKGFGRRTDDRSKEPISIGAVVDRLLLEGVFARGMPIATLASKWPQVVGERLATETSPISLEGGVLTVGATNGPWGAQARFLNDEIRKRAEEALGDGTVTSVRIVVRNPS